MIDEVDTVQDVSLEPAAPGLDLICRGIRICATGDAESLDEVAEAIQVLDEAPLRIGEEVRLVVDERLGGIEPAPLGRRNESTNA